MSAPAQEDAESVSRELEQLRQRIAVIESELSSTLQRRDALVAELARIEKASAETVRKIRETGEQVAAAERRLEQLAAEEQALEEALSRQRLGLAKQLRAAYAMGRQSRLKIWLDRGDPAGLGRALAYYRYLNASRLRQIEAVTDNLARLAAVRENTRIARSRLVSLGERLAGERKLQAEQRDEREKVLAAINARVRDRDRELADMREQQARLEQLLNELQQVLSDIPRELSAHDFAELKGRLRWPVEGRFLKSPGQAKEGGLHSAGALIGAPRGTDVRAVSRGRVAYADWLRGFGLITIVDHGDGYMSLYAFNDSLFKDVGDWVETGERLAVVGDSGGRQDSAIYFELRKDGQPLNLAPWFERPRPD